MKIYDHIPWTGISFWGPNDKLMFLQLSQCCGKVPHHHSCSVTIFADKFHLLKLSSLLSVVRSPLIQSVQWWRTHDWHVPLKCQGWQQISLSMIYQLSLISSSTFLFWTCDCCHKVIHFIFDHANEIFPARHQFYIFGPAINNTHINVLVNINNLHSVGNLNWRDSFGSQKINTLNCFHCLTHHED